MKPLNVYLLNQIRQGASGYELAQSVRGVKAEGLQAALIELAIDLVNTQRELNHVRGMYSQLFEDTVMKNGK